MQRIRLSVIVLLLVILCSCCLPAGAVLQTFTYKGYTTAVQPDTGNLTILATHKWGCTSDEYGTLNCGWVAISPMVLTGKVPAGEAFSVIKTGATVEATSIGSKGRTWTGLGLLIPVYEKGGWYATDLFGDIGSLPAPLISSYQVTVATTPDCQNCTRPPCPARSSTVTILRDSVVEADQTLFPGETLRYEDPVDQSAAFVTFVRGQASSQLCPDIPGGMSSIQAVSVYIVHVEPSRTGPIPTPQTTTGILAVASIPSGATVILDGSELGQTPFSRPGLAPGAHSLRVEKNGYAPWEKDITIFSAGYSTWTASLQPLYGSLSVRSFPSHATVTVDGIDEGFTPLTLKGVPAGIHRVAVSKEGFKPEERPANVAGGDITLLLFNLAPIDSPVDVTAAA